MKLKEFAPKNRVTIILALHQQMLKNIKVLLKIQEKC